MGQRLGLVDLDQDLVLRVHPLSFRWVGTEPHDAAGDCYVISIHSHVKYGGDDMSGEKLLVADVNESRLDQYDVASGELEHSATGTCLAEHAGTVHVPGAARRLLYVDDLRGELVEVSPWAEKGQRWRRPVCPVAIPGEHLALSPAGTAAVVTTGLGRSFDAWSQLLSVADLSAGRSVQVRSRAGEPGVGILERAGRTWVLVRHREPGHLDVHKLEALLGAGPHCPQVQPARVAVLPDDGHGDLVDAIGGRFLTATGAGVVVVRLHDDGTPQVDLVPYGVPGRAFYLRLGPDADTVWAVVRGGPADPRQWPDWSNHLWRHDLRTGRSTSTALGPGLVFRLAITAEAVAVARTHPDGDELVAVPTVPSTADEARPDGAASRLPLPAMAHPPRPGSEPWDACDRRAVDGSPASGSVAVSRGGDGEVHLFDLNHRSAATATRTLRTPGRLVAGGHLTLAHPSAPVDTVGR